MHRIVADKLRRIAWLIAPVVFGCHSSASEPAQQKPPMPASAIDLKGTYAIEGFGGVVAPPDSGFLWGVTIRNTGDTPLTVGFSGCWSLVQLYRTPDRSGPPAFDQGANPLLSCELFYAMRTVQPGESTQITQRWAPSSFQSDVGPGHYYLGLRVAPNGVERVIPAGEIDVPR